MYGYRSRNLKANDSNTMQEVANSFLSEKPHKTVFGNFRIIDDNSRLVYQCQTQKELAGGNDIDRAKLVKCIRSGEYELVSPVDCSEVMAKNDGGNWQHYRVTYKVTETDVIAIKIMRKGEKPLILGNSSILPLIGRVVAYGNVTRNRTVTEIQKVLETKVRMIPFSVFKELNLALEKVKIVDQGTAEIIKRKVLVKQGYGDDKDTYRWESVHFVGPVVFEVEGKQMLLDLDRREVGFGIWNPFVVILNSRVSSVSEAYESLKPKAVKDALKAGLDVKRQGEWFFIPCSAPKLPKLTELEKALCLYGGDRLFGAEEKALSTAFGKSWLNKMKDKARKLRDAMIKPVSLKAGDNRPNNAEQGIKQGKVVYVTGTITHSGREHHPLKLTTWHQAVPNTAVKSFTVTGDID